MIRKYNKIICIFILPIFLTGCWDYKDINDRTIGITIALDSVNDEITILGELIKLSSGNSEETSMNNKITQIYKYKASGKTFENMRTNFDVQVPGPDFSQSVVALVISKRYAEKMGIESYMNRTYFSQGLRSSVTVAVSEESADELFSKKVDNTVSIGYGIENTLRYLEKEGMTIQKSIQEIQSDISLRSIGYLIPYVTVQNNTTKSLGFAAMVDSKLVGIINGGESNGFLLILSKKAGETRAIPSPSDDKNLLSITSNLRKRSIRTSYEDNKINIYIHLKLESVMKYQYHIEPLSNENIKKVDKIIEYEIKKNVLAAINRSQKEFKSDVFGFARYFKAENPMVYRTINWEKEYTEAVFHVNVDTTITSTGLLDPNAEKPK